MDLLRQYGCLEIAQKRKLYDIRYPLFVVADGHKYDIEYSLSFVQALDYLRQNHDGTINVLDSFDLGYYGYFNYWDLLEYESVHNL